jgi:hypothetical protein
LGAFGDKPGGGGLGSCLDGILTALRASRIGSPRADPWRLWLKKPRGWLGLMGFPKILGLFL